MKIILFSFPIISSIVLSYSSKRIGLSFLADIFDTRVLNFANQLPFRSILEIKGGEGGDLNGSANCRTGSRIHNARPRSLPSSPFRYSAPWFSWHQLLHPLPIGERREDAEGDISSFLFLSLSLTFVAWLASSRREGRIQGCGAWRKITTILH